LIDSYATTGGERKPEQMFDLEGEYALRHGRRIAKRFAQRHHMEEALALRGRNDRN
jgi:hypothetical protein